MDIIRNVSDIGPTDRTALEHVLGQPLNDQQQVVVRIVNREAAEVPPPQADSLADSDATLPDWCNALEGMSDADLAEFAAGLQTPVRLAHFAE